MTHSNQSMKRKGLLTASSLILAVVSGFAQAEIVTQWSYSTNATFSNPTWSTGGGFTDVIPEKLSWGNSAGNFQVNSTDPAANRSALTVGNFAALPTPTLFGGGPAQGSVTTDQNGVLEGAEIARGVSFTHWNNVLLGTYSTLTSARITDVVTLTPTAPADPLNPQTGPTLTFNFQFRETPNGGNASGTCADGKSAVTDYGYNGVTGGCPDLFGYIETQTVNQSFRYDNRDYFVSVLSLLADGSLDTIGIAPLSAGECSALNLVGVCFGFSTLEGLNTTARFGFAVSAAPLSVPEPGSIALIGLALAGLGVTRRRLASKSA